MPIVTVNGQQVSVNSAGIINTRGPMYGKYPAEVQRAAAPVAAPASPRQMPAQPVPGAPTGTTPSLADMQAAQERLLEQQRSQQQAFLSEQRALQQQGQEAGRRDAYAQLSKVLADYGLGSLGGTVQSWLQQGLSESEIVQQMRDTTEFKTRFPAIEARKKKGLSAISPGEYVAYERNARQLMRAAGIPEGFYDSTEDFSKFLTNDLSVAELGERVTMAANAAFKMPKEDRDALTRFGMNPGDLTAFFLDPDKAQPLLERKYVAAQLAGASQRSTFGTLDEGTATELAALGVTGEQAERGFGQLVDARELFTSLDSGEDTIGQADQLGAVFKGNAAAKRRIEQRARKRSATFEGGGGFASSQQGLVGLGDTD